MVVTDHMELVWRFAVLVVSDSARFDLSGGHQGG